MSYATTFYHRWAIRRLALGLALALLVAGCGDDGAHRDANLNVQVIGWGPSNDDGSLGFQPRLPAYADASQVRVSLTQPQSGRLLHSETFRLDDRQAKVPKLEFGQNLRLEFSLLDDNADPVAAGATPLFDFSGGDVVRGFRIQVDAVDAFTPVGSVVKQSGRTTLVQSSLDRRAIPEADSDRWLGRIGHASAAFDDQNKAVIVGGADVLGKRPPASMPQFRTVHDDVMTFDPGSGYFTDLSYDPDAGQARPGGADRLSQARAYHTLTKVGDAKFLVVGGLAQGSSGPRVLGSIEVVDLNAQPGNRVHPLEDADGNVAELADPRAFHTATYRAADNTVVVVGGIGSEGDQDVLSSVEYIELDSGHVESGGTLTDARAEHQAVRVDDDGTIWVMGGRDASGALASVEAIGMGESGDQITREQPMNVARFGFSALRLSVGSGDIVVAVGGYTDLSGAVTGAVELTRPGFDSFSQPASATLQQPRGNLRAIELPRTHNIVVLGGRDGAQTRITGANILEFGSLSSTTPYTATPTNTQTFDMRSDFSATPLANGKILLVGGIGSNADDQIGTLPSAEYFTPTDPIRSTGPLQ